MAITTLDGVLAGAKPPRFISKSQTATPVAGRPQSLWPVAGMPGPGSYDTTLNGVVLSSASTLVPGQIPFDDPGSGDAYLARLTAAASQAGHLLLCDRIWHNGGISVTSTSAQAITSPAWPARDANGATAGDGVLLGVEVSAATGAGTPTLTVGYTNQAGTSGRTGTNVAATTASATVGAFYPIGLAAGDTGVRSVQSLTLSATWTSGTINLVAYRVLAALELPQANIPNAIDALTSGFPKLAAGSVPFLIHIPNSGTAFTLVGSVAFTQG